MDLRAFSTALSHVVKITQVVFKSKKAFKTSVLYRLLGIDSSLYTDSSYEVFDWDALVSDSQEIHTLFKKYRIKGRYIFEKRKGLLWKSKNAKEILKKLFVTDSLPYEIFHWNALLWENWETHIHIYWKNERKRYEYKYIYIYTYTLYFFAVL